jgi:hypothetical protein
VRLLAELDELDKSLPDEARLTLLALLERDGTDPETVIRAAREKLAAL